MKMRHVILITTLAIGVSTAGVVTAQPKTRPKGIGPSVPAPSVAPTTKTLPPAYFKPSKDGADKASYPTAEAATVKCFVDPKHKLQVSSSSATCIVDGEPLVSEVPARCINFMNFTVLVDGVESGSNAAPVSNTDKCKASSGYVYELSCPQTAVKMVRVGKDTCVQTVPVAYVYAPPTCTDANCSRTRIVSDEIVDANSVKCPEGSALTKVGPLGVYCKR